MPTLERQPPGGVLRFFLRSPIWLYRAHLGWLLGGRFLMLTHTGRVSGKLRQTVIEVVHHNEQTGAYYVASGWGEKADWLRNIQKNPDVLVNIRSKRFPAKARRLTVEQGGELLFEYAQRHPGAFRSLSKLMLGKQLQATETDCTHMAESVPLVGLYPGRK